MANFNEIIQEINTNLPDNNKQSITAKKLRDTFIYTLYGTEEEYDISANNNGVKYEDLTAALGTDALNVPIDIRKGGMTIRFINNSDIYEQWRYTCDSIENVDFVNISNWTGITNVPVTKIAEIGDDIFEEDLDIVDENGNVLGRFSNGHIQVKNFNSADFAPVLEYIGISNVPEFDPSESYDIGEIVKYENYIYRFIDAHSAGDWDPSQVQLEHISSPIDVTDDGSAESDLEFSDEHNNILVRFANGNIQVKNFNSGDFEDFNKLLLNQKFKDKKFAIIGDSASTYAGWLPSDVMYYEGDTYPTYYPNGDVDDVNKTWWYKMCTYMGIDPSTQLNNCSWSGSQVTGSSTSTTSAYAACSNKRIDDLMIRQYFPDIIICWISCNDWLNNVDLGNWQVTNNIPAEGTISQARAAYALMLNKLHTMYPKSRIFCCTILDDVRYWPSNNGNGVSTYQWNQNIIEIANAFGCDVIDLHNCGINYSNFARYYSVDSAGSGLQPNAAGQTLIAKKIIAELNAKY